MVQGTTSRGQIKISNAVWIPLQVAIDSAATIGDRAVIGLQTCRTKFSLCYQTVDGKRRCCLHL